MGMHHDHPRNIILMQKPLEKAFNQQKWAVLPQADGTLQVCVSSWFAH